MTKVQMETGFKKLLRQQKKKFCTKLDEQRNKWSIVVGVAFLFGIMLGQVSERLKIVNDLGQLMK